MGAAQPGAAVVTGAARGIGRAIAQALAREGRPILVADIDGEGAALTADSLPGTAVSLAIDVRESRSVAEMFAFAHRSLGPVTLLVNNAAIVTTSPTGDLSDECWDDQLAVNLTGVFYGCREYFRYLEGSAGSGNIVNLASVAGFRVTHPERHTAYDVAKAGVVQLTKVLAAEWAYAGIRVNAVAPGYTATPLLESHQQAEDQADRVKLWTDQIPQRRLAAPDEIAAGVAFLASGAAAAVTGHVLVLDGGYSL